jgi:hypothetical protein
MQHAVRPSDTVARLAGDEFTVILEGLGGPADARMLAAKLVATLREPVMLGGESRVITASVGVALSIPGETDEAALLRKADAARYEAKRRGRDGYHCEGRWPDARGRSQPAAGGGVLTIRDISRSSARSRSSHSPLCTGEVWMAVLRGATSQSKRSRADRWRSGPAAAPPAQMAGSVPSVARMASRSTVGSSARRRSASSAMPAFRKPRDLQETTTPALTNSPRSTRGTTRTMA